MLLIIYKLSYYGQQFHTAVHHASSPVVEAGEGVLKLLPTGALGHPPETGAVPVDLSAG